MDPVMIFGLQFVLSLFVFTLIAVWYAAPWLSEKSVAAVLTILILPHAFRHIGLSFLVPNLNSGTLPGTFAAAAGYGDLASGLLAILALSLLHWRSRMALPLVWVFNIVGLADLLNALRQAEAIGHFGPTWFIPTFLVPLLLVTHVMIFVTLVKRTAWSKPFRLRKPMKLGPRYRGLAHGGSSAK